MAKRKYSREFKVSAVQLVNHQGDSIVEAAQSLGVDPSCVRAGSRSSARKPVRLPAAKAPCRPNSDGSARRTSGCRWSVTF